MTAAADMHPRVLRSSKAISFRLGSLCDGRHGGPRRPGGSSLSCESNDLQGISLHPAESMDEGALRGQGQSVKRLGGQGGFFKPKLARNFHSTARPSRAKGSARGAGLTGRS